jgi:hypothetical protein
VVQITQQPCMYEGEMANVKEVLDHPWPLRLEALGASTHFPEGIVAPLRKIGHAFLCGTQTHPYQSVFLTKCIRGGACSRGRWLGRMRRDPDAPCRPGNRFVSCRERAACRDERKDPATHTGLVRSATAPSRSPEDALHALLPPSVPKIGQLHASRPAERDHRS